MNAKRRLAKLEQARGTGDKTTYFCISYPEDTEYKAKPFGGAGETLTFKTDEAMTAYFDKRADLELLHIHVIRASVGEPEKVNKP